MSPVGRAGTLLALTIVVLRPEPVAAGRKTLTLLSLDEKLPFVIVGSGVALTTWLVPLPDHSWYE